MEKEKNSTGNGNSRNNEENSAIAVTDHGNREVKSSVFTAFFGESKNAAALYDAIAGTSGTRPEDIRYETLEGVLFMARKNDLSFLANETVLVISEHQSTINENMSLRNLVYYGRTVERLINPRDLYRERRIKIPTPEFYVFYNGAKDYPLEKEMKFSDSFMISRESYMMDLTTKVININKEKGHSILAACQPMKEYSDFMEYIRQFMRTEDHNREKAIILAIRKCREEGIMTEFLNRHSSEVENMLFTQWNWDDALEVAKEEAIEIAKEELRDTVKAEVEEKVKAEVEEKVKAEVEEKVKA
ncbi:MAG: hypothetical protein LUF27_15835, partial [Lachnospiraceae bacterium]|nr:hypothetical protein [Lachnospiraceae bacterium]